jgi:hypothetical protein
MGRGTEMNPGKQMEQSFVCIGRGIGSCLPRIKGQYHKKHIQNFGHFSIRYHCVRAICASMDFYIYFSCYTSTRYTSMRYTSSNHHCLYLITSTVYFSAIDLWEHTVLLGLLRNGAKKCAILYFHDISFWTIVQTLKESALRFYKVPMEVWHKTFMG